MYMWYMRVWLVFVCGSCIYMYVDHMHYMHMYVYLHRLLSASYLLSQSPSLNVQQDWRPASYNSPLSTPHSSGVNRCLQGHRQVFTWVQDQISGLKLEGQAP